LDTRHLVDPDLLPLLDVFPSLDMSPPGLPATRAILKTMDPPDMGAADGLPVTVEARMIPGPQGPDSLRVLIVRRAAASGAVCGGILHFHGGGFLVGTPEGSLPLLRATAAAQDCVIVTVDYRLAPETTWVEATEDAHAALVWMVDHAADLGVDPARIGVMGESAGGGLAACTALIARDRGGPALAFQNLLYPMLDDRTVTRTETAPVTGEFIWTRDSNRHGWTGWLGHAPGLPEASPHAVPARMADLSRLPPAWIGVGALDLFLQEDLAYAQRLMEASVPVDLSVWPSAYHGFDLVGTAAVAIRAGADRQAALARGLAVKG
jgi:acetyl esterase/lipase